MSARQHIDDASVSVMVLCSKHLGLNVDGPMSEDELKVLCNFLIENRKTLWGSEVIPKRAMSEMRCKVGVAAAIREIQEAFRC